MKKTTVVIKRKDLLKEMAIKLGIYDNFELNDFLGIVSGIILETDDGKSPFGGYSFEVVDDDYEFNKFDTQYDPELFRI